LVTKIGKMKNNNWLERRHEFKADKVDKLIDASTLSKTDKRSLYVYIRREYATTKEALDSYSEYINQPFTAHLSKRMTEAIKVHNLYESIGIDEDDFIHHWRYYRGLQIVQNRETKSMPKQLRKDNKTYINYGSGNCHSSRIRYPRKKRKTAWKRFYKLFPHLKPIEDEQDA